MDKFTKDDISIMVQNCFLYKKDVCFDFDDLVFAFGFKRMDGEEILMRQLFSSKSEEQLQILPMNEIRDNIEKWCIKNYILYHYDHIRNQYTFRKYE